MKPDTTILARFQELADMAERIEKTSKPSKYMGQGDTVDAELFYQWATSATSLVARACGGDGIHLAELKKGCAEFQGYRHVFRCCLGVFQAAFDDYKGGHVVSNRALVDAELCSDVLDQAGELLAASYKDAACVVAGVALESAVRELCKARSIELGKLDAMNSALAKAGVYNLGMQKQITAWADRRNNAAHGKWDAYSAADVQDLIDGARRFVADRF